jgi:hypothetical protein
MGAVVHLAGIPSCQAEEMSVMGAENGPRRSVVLRELWEKLFLRL